MRATDTQSEAEEQAYRTRIREKARSGALQVPILMYKGKQDVFDWDADAPHASMHGALNLFDMVGAKNPRVKLMIINDATHFVNRDQPEQFNADRSYRYGRRFDAGQFATKKETEVMLQ